MSNLKEPLWILLESVYLIHKRQLAEHGGKDGIRDQSLLESALNRAKHIFYYERSTATIARMAAAYAYGIAKNHPFFDGNKRTSLVICETFLRINKHTLVSTPEEKYSKFLGLISGDVSEEDFSNWISDKLVSRI